MLQWPPILAKVQPHQRVQVTKRGSGTFNTSAFVIKTGSTTQWQADLTPKEMAASDMRNRRHVQMLLTWSTNAAHPKYAIQSILTGDLNKRKRCCRIVPKILSQEEMLNRKGKYQDALDFFIERSDFIECIITGNETWVYAYKPETKRQSLE
ncbi:hypothetical protein LAZ67_X000844 [Cordylochernes scorpioides]|uniref:Uncharacterized protein n=1 Tax=Cordylochernes scorpioides TaxID=51811 RepID=A0ABY6LSD0_9ARAC|nr:hypothetical protein LAZ67_X000844 [Cordylochernes scorpioides]